MPQQTYADSSGIFAPPGLASRRRLFDVMLQQGLVSGPIQGRNPWPEGLGRLTQALVGGYGGYRADEQEREGLRELGGILGSSLPGAPAPGAVGKLGTSASPLPSTPSAVLSAPATGTSEPGTYPGVRPDTAFTDRWRAFLDDLRKAGVTIDPTQSGGYNPRNIAGTSTPSLHASDQAYDVNWRANPEGQVNPSTPLPYDMYGEDARVPTSQVHPDIARDLAQRHGMRWGGDFTGRSPDPMHFEVAGGVPMAQRSLTARAGLPPPMRLGGPSLSDTGDVSGGAQPSAPAAPQPPAPVGGEGLLPFPLPPMPRTPQPPVPEARPNMPPTLMQEAGPSQPLPGPPSAVPGPAPVPGAAPVVPPFPQGTVTPTPGPAPVAPSAAAPGQPAAAAPQTASATDVIRRLLQSRNPQAIRFGMQLYADLSRRGGTNNFEMHKGTDGDYIYNKATGAFTRIGGGPGGGTAANIAGGINELASIPGRYGGDAGVFGSSVGSFQGDPSFNMGMGPLSRAWGSLSSNLATGANSQAPPAEVRRAVEGATATLAQTLKPLIRKPGEGTWSDRDQAVLDSIVGNLTQANNVQQYQRELENVRQRIMSNFGVQLPAIGAQASGPSGTAVPAAGGWQTVRPGVRIREMP